MISKQQIKSIENLRATNHSYSSIARILDLPVNSVKSVCRRHNFTVDEAHNAKPAVSHEELIQCKYCGKLMDNLWHRQKKAFCSDRCRWSYWNREKRLTHYISPARRKELSEETLDFPPKGSVNGIQEVNAYADTRNQTNINPGTGD